MYTYALSYLNAFSVFFRVCHGLPSLSFCFFFFLYSLFLRVFFFTRFLGLTARRSQTALTERERPCLAERTKARAGRAAI